MHTNTTTEGVFLPSSLRLKSEGGPEELGLHRVRTHQMPLVVAFLPQEGATMEARLPQSISQWPEPWAQLHTARVERMIREQRVHPDVAYAEVEAELRSEFMAAVRRKERAAQEAQA